MLDPVPAAPPILRLLEVHEVAYQLKCSQETVRRFIRSGTLPAVRLGSHWRIKQAALETFIDSLTHQIAREERSIDQRFESARSKASA